ncbi:MAG: AI-2E family transporter [bacterium]
MPNIKRSTTINISTLTIVKIIVVLIVLYFLYLISDIIALLFASLIFASAVDPWIDWMQLKKIPRSIGMLIVYLVLLAIISFVVYLLIPPIAHQTSELSSNFPQYVDKASSAFFNLQNYASEHEWMNSVKKSIGNLSSNLEIATKGIFATLYSVFGGIFAFFLVLVITFYMVVEENAMKKLVWSITPDKHQSYVIGLINRIQRKIGMWFRGQLFLGLIIFCLTYIGLSILGVKYALVLALIAGIMEVIPYLGPILSAIPAVFLAFTQSPTLALFVLMLYIVIQIVENNILVPKIMQKAVGLNPIISISVLMIGLEIGGIIGAILAIPVATALSVAVKDLFNYHKTREIK